MELDVQLRQEPARRWVGVRETVRVEKIGELCGRGLPETMRRLGAAGIRPVSPPLNVYHSHDAEKGTFDLTVGFFVDRSAPVEALGLDVGEVPAGEVAAATWRGAYQRLGEAHDAISRFVSAHGRASRGPCWDAYLNDPGEVPPEEYLTEVVWPVAGR